GAGVGRWEFGGGGCALVVCCSLCALTASWLLPSAYCLLPTAYCLLPTAYCLLPTAYCLLPTAHRLLPTASSPRCRFSSPTARRCARRPRPPLSRARFLGGTVWNPQMSPGRLPAPRQRPQG